MVFSHISNTFYLSDKMKIVPEIMVKKLCLSKSHTKFGIEGVGDFEGSRKLYMTSVKFFVPREKKFTDLQSG